MNLAKEQIFKMRITIILLLFIVSGCGSFSNSDIAPFEIQDKVSSYHCWPYNVDVYSVSNIKIDSLFYTYPLKSYFGNNPKYKVANWSIYSDIDTTEWYGMDKELSECDDNTELYNQRLKGSPIYYAGSYRYNKNQQGDRRITFEKILFLDLANNRLHIFQDINKVY